MNSGSIQEGNQSIHIYFKEKKRRRQPINSKFVIIIMRITKQRPSEAFSQDPFIRQNSFDNRKYFYEYYEITNLEQFMSV
jgi:hypothetical protein